MILAEELDADWSLVRSRHGTQRRRLRRPAVRHPPHRRLELDQEHLHAVPRTRRAHPRHAARRRGGAAGRWTPPRCAREAGIGASARRHASWATASWPRPRWQLPVPEKVTLKDPKDFRLIGKPTAPPRCAGQDQRPAGVTASTCGCPGMLTAVVARPPVFGARLKSVDDSAAQRRQGREGRAARAAGPRRRGRGRGRRRLLAGQAGPRRAQAASGTPAPSRRSTATQQLAQYRELASQPGPRKYDADMAPLGRGAAASIERRVRLPLPRARADGAAQLHGAPSTAARPSSGSARRCRASTPWPRRAGAGRASPSR